jgi:hypothetical protein
LSRAAAIGLGGDSFLAAAVGNAFTMIPKAGFAFAFRFFLLCGSLGE